jgi:beta-barrel assembly-enhancing protease
VLFLLQGVSSAQSDSPQKTHTRGAIVSAALASRSAKPLNAYHDGRIRDISAVGNRDVGCTSGLGSRYSLEEQIEIGGSFAEQVMENSKLITDPVITDYINRIGQNLASNSDAQIPFTFTIVDAEEVNAFSLPGGFIFVNSGLIRTADNEAELAGVISHEIAHVAACHAAQEMAREELANSSSFSLLFRIAGVRTTQNTIYSKPISFEFEADFLGVEYLYKAGYDPHGLASVLGKLRVLQNHRPGRRANAFASRYQMIDRIRELQKEINTLPAAAEYKLDTSEFQNVRERLSTLSRDQKPL